MCCMRLGYGVEGRAGSWCGYSAKESAGVALAGVCVCEHGLSQSIGSSVYTHTSAHTSATAADLLAKQPHQLPALLAYGRAVHMLAGT